MTAPETTRSGPASEAARVKEVPGSPAPGSPGTSQTAGGGSVGGPPPAPFESPLGVRPWYHGKEGDHLYPDCEDLTGDPVEGAGWLDPDGGDVCVICLERFAPEYLDEDDGWDDADED